MVNLAAADREVNALRACAELAHQLEDVEATLRRLIEGGHLDLPGVAIALALAERIGQTCVRTDEWLS